MIRVNLCTIYGFSQSLKQAGVVIAVKCDRDNPARVKPEVPVWVVRG